MLCTCQNCKWKGPVDEAEPVHDIWSRIEPGEPMPAGDCPECGAFVQPIMPSGAREVTVRKNNDGISAGHYHLTYTVRSDRMNLFTMEPGRARLIATLVSGSASMVEQFNFDAEKIVRALATLDANEQRSSSFSFSKTGERQ